MDNVRSETTFEQNIAFIEMPPYAGQKDVQIQNRNGVLFVNAKLSERYDWHTTVPVPVVFLITDGVVVNVLAPESVLTQQVPASHL